ncbi:hypothetical protein [Treponema pectinovorum]|uniref:hypothetical protein n=1 Tax=Treponema pectinovorum TaxID=164 RepID=UPI0011C94636|nr:hypothetical protein [Treponema pectinovorum]
MENLKIFITVVAYCIFAFLILRIPFEIKRLKKECGKIKMELKSDFPIRSYAIFAVCAALIGIIPFRNFALYISVVFICTALIATALASRQVANSKMNGIFENMIISDTTAIKYEQILCLPTLAYEKDEDTSQVDFRLLEILPKKGSKITLVFPNEETRNKALDAILKECPSLAQC